MVIEEWELDSWDDENEKFYQGDSYLEPWDLHVNETLPLQVVIPGTLAGCDADLDFAHNIPKPHTHLRLHKRFLQDLVNVIKGTAGKIGRGGRCAGRLVRPGLPKIKVGTRGGNEAKKSTAEQSAKVKDMLDKEPLKW